jgi:hypothetical protein
MEAGKDGPAEASAPRIGLGTGTFLPSCRVRRVMSFDVGWDVI